MAKGKNNQSKTNNYSSFGVGTLIKLAAIEAGKNHGGAFEVHANEDGYKVAFGASIFDGAGRFETRALPTLKEALIAALAGEWATTESTADESALAASSLTRPPSNPRRS
jgi:hypothetical protein